jgi:hypothetical protein
MLVKKTAKIALLLFGLFPFICAACFSIMLEPGEISTALFFTILIILAAISVSGAPILYFIHVCRNKYIAKDGKYLWIALFFFGNFFVFPFYWYLHVWRVPKETCRRETPTNDDSGECESIPAR